MGYFYYNANPKGIRTGDCVVRALSYFLGMTWKETLFSLVNWGAERGLVLFHYRSFYNKYLFERGYKKERVLKGCTVREFCELYAEDGKCYLLQCPHHVTIIHDKDIIDTWDCEHLKVDGYWVKRDFEQLDEFARGRCWDDGNF